MLLHYDAILLIFKVFYYVKPELGDLSNLAIYLSLFLQLIYTTV